MGIMYPIPVDSKITSPFGSRTSPTAGASTNHKGIDFSVPLNTEVKAATSGTVAGVGFDSSRGNYVTIDNGAGLITNYYHLSKANVKQGDKVTTGQGIALSGNTGISTGPHLHFETVLNGVNVDPLTLLDKDAKAYNKTVILETPGGTIDTIATTTKAAIDKVINTFKNDEDAAQMDSSTTFFIGAMVIVILLFFKS